ILSHFLPTLTVLLFAGICLGVEIKQTPSETLKNPGDEVQLVCSHGKTDFTYMQWYQKPAGDPALKRIGHLNYGDAETETSFGNRFRIDGNLSGEKAKNASLFVQKLQVEDSGVFYCANPGGGPSPERRELLQRGLNISHKNLSL
uniref:Ig-like domain-containing protein n=1 Tax=Oryzias sinensis TaxID=183150 RepID=A0A8C7X2R4_9TELE